MPDDDKPITNRVLDKAVDLLLGLPWMDVLAELWKLIRTFWRGLADEGIYEVVEYESTLELKDRTGRRAEFRKREKVRYLQNNIIAYQDHAWGDGQILVDYHCQPGVVVDQYRPGQKTFLLISLRESKQRGDVDEFNIRWGLRAGFIRDRELWETEVRHRTKKMRVQILFPKLRPPLRVWLEEHIRRKRKALGKEAIQIQPDGRWQVTWQTTNPRLNERYRLHWTW